MKKIHYPNPFYGPDAYKIGLCNTLWINRCSTDLLKVNCKKCLKKWDRAAKKYGKDLKAILKSFEVSDENN